MPGLALVSAPNLVLTLIYILVGLEAGKKGSAEGHVSLDSDQSGNVMGGWFFFLIRKKETLIRGL